MEPVTEYLRQGGATVTEIGDFQDWCEVMCTQRGEGAGDAAKKRRRFWCYRMWARLLRVRRSPFPRNGKFIFDERLKVYVRLLTGGDPVDPPNPPDGINILPRDFVNSVC